MDWRNRLPRPPGRHLTDNVFEILKMPPDEYRRKMRAEGFGDDYIDRELAELARAREQRLVPGLARPAPPPPPPADAGVFEFLLRRRKERQRRTEDHDD